MLIPRSLNNLLKELSKNENLLTCVNQHNLGRRMEDRMLVLRFLAFYQMTYLKAKKGLKSFFNEFTETYRSEEKIREYKKAFKYAMRACNTVFGDKGFRLRKKAGLSSGEWAPRINASIFQVISVSFTDYDIGAITRTADNIYEAYVDLVSTDNDWADCVQRTTGDSARIEYVFEAWNERLEATLKDSIPNDLTRLFSRQLKEEMFQQDNNCSICKQRIQLINDAAMDHQEEYWRRPDSSGERTISSSNLQFRTKTPSVTTYQFAKADRRRNKD